MNMIDKTSGEIEVFGKDNQKHEIEIKQNIGYVPAEDYFILNSTLKQHAEAFKLFYNIWDNELFNDLCEMWNLNKSQKIYKYSTGMKTKAMLALALAHKPKLLILDEPTSGLDPIAREEVLEIVKSFSSKKDKSVLFSTHIVSDLDKVADRIAIIDNGKVIEDMCIENIKDKYCVIKGDINQLSKFKEKVIGFKARDKNFEGLALKSDIEHLKYIEITETTLEKLLIYTLIGDLDEKIKKIIKSF